MGEYIIYRGTERKIGTCESLYYTTFQRFTEAIDKGELEKSYCGGEALDYTRLDGGFLFRFPFPDEDHIGQAIFQHDDFDRGLLVEVNKGSIFTDFPIARTLVTTIGRRNAIELIDDENPNNRRKTALLEIVFQKHVTERVTGRPILATVYRCPFCNEMWRADSFSEGYFLAEQVAVFAEKMDGGERALYTEVALRIKAGYDMGKI